ncbi:hypothetical protein CM15mP43_09710 [bacterium]|nr:MAG: hypothetical protein CM15mP43_09710 [bacterium]
MSNKFQQWISSELKEIKKNNLHRTLTEIDSSMSPEIIINKKNIFNLLLITIWV